MSGAARLPALAAAGRPRCSGSPPSPSGWMSSELMELRLRTQCSVHKVTTLVFHLKYQESMCRLGPGTVVSEKDRNTFLPPGPDEDTPNASVWSTTNQIDWIIITMENLSWSNSVKVHISIDVENKPTRMFVLLHHQWRCWSFSFKPWFKTCKNEFIRQYDDRHRNICDILTHRVSRFLTFEHIYEPEVCLASLIRQKSNVFFVFFFWITRCSTAARSVGVRHSGWSELLQLLLLWCLLRVGLIFRSSSSG